jgi:diadenosine tetraphosphate (Ap4A) HIT family hydrolase
MGAAEPRACFVCEKHRLGDGAEGGVLFEDDLMYVGHVHTLAGPTAYRGHLVVEPRRHVPGIGDLRDSEATALGRTCSRMARLLQRAGGAEHVYLYVVGDDVAHLHVHLVPRYPGTPREHWGPGVTRWPDAPRVDPESMRTLLSDLRRQLGTS